MAHTKVIVVAGETDEPAFSMLQDVPHVLITESPVPEQVCDGITTILYWSSPRLLREMFPACHQLRWIHSRSAGLDNLLFSELVHSDVILTNGKGIFSATLGEFALAAILYFAKDLPRMRKNQVAHKWAPFDVERIEGQTVGIVGYGDIGRAVATRVYSMGMRVLATKRHIPKEPDSFIERYYLSADMHAMLALSDYVVVTAPLTPETRHMISDAEFAAMKPTAIIINVGRGPVIDEQALVRALIEKQIKGAGLDVVEHEPLPEDSPLYAMENVLLSPHCADNVAGWKEDAMRFFLEQYARYEKNEPLQNVVDKHLGY
jgi:phosphoglycerate dehydrogenase-like enzyme